MNTESVRIEGFCDSPPDNLDFPQSTNHKSLTLWDPLNLPTDQSSSKTKQRTWLVSNSSLQPFIQFEWTSVSDLVTATSPKPINHTTKKSCKRIGIPPTYKFLSKSLTILTWKYISWSKSWNSLTKNIVEASSQLEGFKMTADHIQRGQFFFYNPLVDIRKKVKLHLEKLFIIVLLSVSGKTFLYKASSKLNTVLLMVLVVRSESNNPQNTE